MSALFSRVTGSLAFRAMLAVGFVYCAPRAATTAPTITQAETKGWVCPPCRQPCDGVVHEHAGVCPVCGMALVPQGAAADAAPSAGVVAVLVFDGVEIIDFSGPFEVFGAAGFDVYTVAATKSPVTTAMGMTVVPKHTFEDAPAPNVVVVPGGGVQGARTSAPTLAWLKAVSARADKTLSVCNGAFILGSAGLLDGLTATTTYGLLAKLTAELPKTRVVDDRRFVDNGKVVTAAGLSSGIDGALHVVEALRGKGRAQAAALSIEYDWREDGAFVRARLADRLIPDLDLHGLGHDWTFDRIEGTTDRWEIAAHGASTKSGAEVISHLTGALAKGKWRPATATVAAPPTSVDLRREDETGSPWTATLTVDPVGAGGHDFAVKLRVARAAQMSK